MSLSIRSKIFFLVAGTLVLSFVWYLLIATNLIVQDKASYIFDYNFAQVRSSAQAIEAQVEKVAVNLHSLGRWVDVQDSGLTPQSDRALRTSLAEFMGQHSAESFAYYSLVRGRYRRVFAALPETQSLLSEAEEEAMVNVYAESLSSDKIRFERPLKGHLPLLGRTFDGAGKSLVYVAYVAPALVLPEELENHYLLALLDGEGRTIAVRSKGAAEDVLQLTEFQPLREELIRGRFDSGVKEWGIGTESYIVGYSGLAGRQLHLVGLISKKLAYSASDALVRRSVALGVSILLVVVGLTLLLVRHLTRKISAVDEATRKVSEGDFSVRIASGRPKGDEIDRLGFSFNIMAERIVSLIRESAQKARMEKELEMAQIIQKRFFPDTDFIHPRFKLSGGLRSASECAGDWWHFSQIGSNVVVVVADVMGHGASAAMVTSSAYSAYMLWVDEQRGKEGQAYLDIEALVKLMNRTVYAAGQGEVTMTTLVSAVDLETGEIRTINNAHPSPMVFQSDGASGALGVMPSVILGVGREISLDVGTSLLKSGDVILWYTDGIFEKRKKDKKRIARNAFSAHIKKLAGSSQPADAKTICGTTLGWVAEFLMEDGGEPSDDITLVVGVFL